MRVTTGHCWFVSLYDVCYSVTLKESGFFPLRLQVKFTVLPGNISSVRKDNLYELMW